MYIKNITIKTVAVLIVLLILISGLSIIYYSVLISDNNGSAISTKAIKGPSPSFLNKNIKSHITPFQANAAPPNIRFQFPITITNNQSTATPNPYQQMIKLNESIYSNYIHYNQSSANFEFTYANNTIIPSWIESNNSGTLTIWLKLYSIPALSSVTIYIDFASLTTNLLSSSGTTGIGEAPQLSPTYGEYDDGAIVFPLYSNFYDTLAGYSAYSYSGSFIPVSSTSPYNDVEMLNDAGNTGAYILSSGNISLGNYILQTYWSYSGRADGFSVSLWGDPKAIYHGGGGYTPGMYNGLTYHYEFYPSGGGTPPGGDPNIASVYSLTGIEAGTLITTAPAEGEGTYYVYSQIAFYNITSNSGRVAIYSKAIGSTSTPNNITPAELYNSTYQSTANFSSIPLSASPILFGAGSGAAASYIYIYWALMRAYPPNGVMPSIQFGPTQKVYEITFAEYGLTSGTAWSVTLNGTIRSSTTNIITFVEPNGTYSYSITPISGYQASSLSGTISVYGSNVNVSISFTRVTYSVTFKEAGLPYGTSWYVNISNGQSFTGTGTTITFNEPNGSYLYTIETSNKNYATNQPSGTFTVNGGNVNIAITFSPVTYTVTFIQNGLPSGTSWSIIFNGITFSSTNSTITFNETNGSYSYIISGISGYRANTYSGTINVNGNSVSVSINWTEIIYSITITENGIPNGTSWSATLTGTTFNGKYINVTLSSTTNTITFNEPNGTYSYFIHMPFGYAGRTKGNIIVSGQSVYINILATSVLVTIAVWVIIIGVIGAAIAVIVRSR
jgi:hypothetical protein